jgi:acyl carrier protein
LAEIAFFFHWEVEMTTDDVMERTRTFVQTTFLYTRPDFRFGADYSLLGNGIIDSMGALELLEFLQTEFGLAIADDEVTESNFGSLGSIARFVLAKRATVEA